MSVKKMFICLIIILYFSGCANLSVNNKKLFCNEKGIVDKIIYDNNLKIKENDSNLLEEITKIVDLIRKNNVKDLNEKYINRDFGFFYLYKIDSNKKVSIFYSIGLYENSNQSLENIFKKIDKKLNVKKIKIEKVQFNCAPNSDAYYGWDKEGIFVSKNEKPFITNIMKKNIFPILKEECKKAKVVEKFSYKIIIAPSLVFYVLKINKEYFIVAFDQIETNCCF